MWRLSLAEPFGLHLWFDPDCEVPELRPLTDAEDQVRLDMIGSVSAPTETEARASTTDHEQTLLDLEKGLPF